MIYTPKIQEAIELAIKTHEIDRKQKRKGKDIPYITHPLTVGIILGLASAKEEVIIAGILHDTIEDCINKTVTKEIITKQFGDEVANLVLSVTEQDKSLSYDQRKKEAIEHIKTFSNDSILLKSADVISNVFEIKDDYEKKGDKIFENFNNQKEKILKVYENVTKELLKKWPENPLKNELKIVLDKIKNMI